MKYLIAFILFLAITGCYNPDPRTNLVLVTDMDTGIVYESCGMPYTYTDKRGSVTHIRFEQQLTEEQAKTSSGRIIEMISSKGFLIDRKLQQCEHRLGRGDRPFHNLKDTGSLR